MTKLKHRNQKKLIILSELSNRSVHPANHYYLKGIQTDGPEASESFDENKIL
jgi:hypothetical protein